MKTRLPGLIPFFFDIFIIILLKNSIIIVI